MGNLGILSPLQLDAIAPGRLKIDLSNEIDKLDLDIAPLMKLLSGTRKEKAVRMKFEWLTKERASEWTDINSFGGGWNTGASTTGTIIVSNDDRWKFAEGDIVKPAGTSDDPISEINLYVDSVGNLDSAGAGLTEIVARVYDNTTTVDFSAAVVPSTQGLLHIGNSFELGSGMGTMKSYQPERQFNYIQIIQTPYGSLTTSEHIAYEVGNSELKEVEETAKLEHQFMKEKIAFFGRKHVETVGYMNNTYEQYFTGGLLEAIQTNVVSPSGALTQAEFGAWVNQSLLYAQKPVIFAGSIIYEALSFWLRGTLKTEQSEKTLGITVATYVNEYGQSVKIIPHRHLLKNRYAGYAFAVDLADIKYKFLQGLDTHLVTDIQLPDQKRTINEFRTWFGFYLGNEKRHGLLKDVSSIDA